MRLRVLTYNMHKGFAFFSRQYVLRELREAIRAVNADVVFLQEVMGVHPERVQDIDYGPQFEFLADEIWSHFAYGKNAVYSKGHHGNAILSKFPFSAFENINISTNPLEQRGLLHAQIKVTPESEALHLVCLHLDLLERGRKRQMTSLVGRVHDHIDDSCPLIVAGDFNDWKRKFSDPLEESLSLNESGVVFTGSHAKTFPSWAPMLSLDRIYIRRFKVHHHQVLSGAPWGKMSDHAAVVAELELI